MADRKEYIERGAVERMLENAQIVSDGEYSGYCTEDISLDEIPTADVVEAVRCEKCLFNGYVQSDGVIHCARESVMGTGTVLRKATDYCSYGERKDDADSD